MRLYTSAQVSIFVIISVIILFLGIGVFFTISSGNIFPDDSPTYRVQEFTQSCLELQSKHALEEVAKKGGWYYTPDTYIYANQNNFNELIESAQGFEHPFYGNLLYWDYYADGGDTMEQYIPNLDNPDDKYSIRSQVNRLIQETINEECLQEYESFSDRYNIDVQIEDLNVTSSSFQDNRLTFELFLPLTIESIEQEGIDSATTFQVTVDNAIKTPYYIANDIVEAQKESSFIENSYLNFIYNYQEAGNDELLPPFYDFKYGVTDYSVIYADEKKPMLQQILDTHSSEIVIQDVGLLPHQSQKVRQTQESTLKSAQVHQRKLFNSDDYNLNSKGLRSDYSEHISKLSYTPFFPISFSFSNGKGAGRVLTHDVTNEMLLIVPVQYTTYQAGYDITTPVVYEIENSNQNSQSDLTFNLPLEINIRNNNPIRALLKDNIRTSSFSSNPTKYTPSYCSQEHFISEDININVREKNQFGEDIPIEGMNFRFTCSTQEEVVCPVETFTSEERANYQQYTLNLPINCPDSELEIYKDDYVSQIVEISPSLNNEITKPVTINEPKTLDFYFDIRGRDLEENQQSFIIFESQNNPQYIQSFSLNHTYQEDLNITLIPDTYTITSFTVDKSTQVIPKQNGKSCSGFSSIFGCEPTPDIPSITLDGWVLSDFRLENYRITQEDLQFASRVSARIPGVPYPQDYDDFKQNIDMPRADKEMIRIE